MRFPHLGGIIICTISLFLLLSCTDKKSTKASTATVEIDTLNTTYQSIMNKGELVALTAYSNTSYFIYKGTPMGYEYELMQGLAKHLGVKLSIKIVPDIDSIFVYLKEGKGDIIAYGITKTLERKKEVDFTTHFNLTEQVLVQKKPSNWRKVPRHITDKKLIRNVFNLIGKEVYVRKNSSYYNRLKHLCEELGDSIKIKTVGGNVPTDDLIKMVIDGKIKYTIADKNIALANHTYYDDLDYNTRISFPQQVAWAVPKNEPILLKSLNHYIDSIKKNQSFYILYSKYFRKSKRQRHIAKSSFNTNNKNALSQFDEQFRTLGENLGWDWRLVASQAYQESRFNPDAKSWAGAVGLMQILPFSASQYGEYDLRKVNENLIVAEKHIKWIRKQFQGLDSINTIKFTLAAYNVGYGHIHDAQKLAKKHGMNPLVWDNNVAEMLLNKSKPEYYNDEVVRNGYCRGTEPYKYVKEIFERYEHYIQFVE